MPVPEIETVFIAEEQFDMELVQVFKSDLQYNQTAELPVGFARRNWNASLPNRPLAAPLRHSDEPRKVGLWRDRK
jgi:hypothetical protein